MSVDPKQFVAEIASALKTRRKSLGLSQDDVADKAQISRSTVSRVEAGKINGTLFVFQSIANALDLPLGEVCRKVEKRAD